MERKELTAVQVRGNLARAHTPTGTAAVLHGSRCMLKDWTIEQMATPWAVGEAVLEHNLGNSVVPTSSTSSSNMFYTMVIGSAVLTIERLDKLFTNKQIMAESGISRSTFTVSRGSA